MKVYAFWGLINSATKIYNTGLQSLQDWAHSHSAPFWDASAKRFGFLYKGLNNCRYYVGGSLL